MPSMGGKPVLWDVPHREGHWLLGFEAPYEQVEINKKGGDEEMRSLIAIIAVIAGFGAFTGSASADVKVWSFGGQAIAGQTLTGSYTNVTGSPVAKVDMIGTRANAGRKITLSPSQIGMSEMGGSFSYQLPADSAGQWYLNAVHTSGEEKGSTLLVTAPAPLPAPPGAPVPGDTPTTPNQGGGNNSADEALRTPDVGPTANVEGGQGGTAAAPLCTRINKAGFKLDRYEKRYAKLSNGGRKVTVNGKKAKRLTQKSTPRVVFRGSAQGADGCVIKMTQRPTWGPKEALISVRKGGGFTEATFEGRRKVTVTLISATNKVTLSYQVK